MFAYRIADARHPIFDPTGAMLYSGRWNSVGVRVIYASEHYAGALLEILVHANLSQLPKNHKVVRIAIPDEVRIEVVSKDQLNGWDAEDGMASRAFGDRWTQEARTAVLKVPSVITGGLENDIVFTVTHPQFSLIVPEPPVTVLWDERLFRTRA